MATGKVRIARRARDLRTPTGPLTIFSRVGGNAAHHEDSPAGAVRLQVDPIVPNRVEGSARGGYRGGIDLCPKNACI